MPSGPFDSIQAPIRQLHAQAGWEGTVYSYTQDDSGGGNWYDDTGGGDSGWVEHAESLTIRVETSTSPSVNRGAGGREITGDAAITVDPTDHPGGREAFTAGAGTENKATEIVDETADQQPRYRATRVERDHSGLLIIQADLLT